MFVVAAIGFVGPGAALGATPTTKGTSAASDQYDKPANAVAGTTGGSSSGGGGSYEPPVAAATSGTLPFTGASLVWPAVGAFALVGLGLALRRHERKH